MKIIKKEIFKVGAWYKTGYSTENGTYIRGREVKCLSISKDRQKAVFLIGNKEQEYDLMGESVCPKFSDDENPESGWEFIYLYIVTTL